MNLYYFPYRFLIILLHLGRCFSIAVRLLEKHMTRIVNKIIKNTDANSIRDSFELTILVAIFIFSTMGVSPTV